MMVVLCQVGYMTTAADNRPARGACGVTQVVWAHYWKSAVNENGDGAFSFVPVSRDIPSAGSQSTTF